METRQISALETKANEFYQRFEPVKKCGYSIMIPGSTSELSKIALELSNEIKEQKDSRVLENMCVPFIIATKKLRDVLINNYTTDSLSNVSAAISGGLARLNMFSSTFDSFHREFFDPCAPRISKYTSINYFTDLFLQISIALNQRIEQLQSQTQATGLKYAISAFKEKIDLIARNTAHLDPSPTEKRELSQNAETIKNMINESKSHTEIAVAATIFYSSERNLINDTSKKMEHNNKLLSMVAFLSGMLTVAVHPIDQFDDSCTYPLTSEFAIGALGGIGSLMLIQKLFCKPISTFYRDITIDLSTCVDERLATLSELSARPALR